MPSSFHSNDVNVNTILSEIDCGDTQLPDFQRGWVWDDNHIRSLIASITNSYPVGAVMFLEHGSDNIRFSYRPFESVKTNARPEKLVLDGQQRLTSIYSSMYCRSVVNTQTEKKQPIKRFYYLDINKCLDAEEERFDAVVSIAEDKMERTNFGRDIVMDLSSREKEFERHMFPLNIVYDHIECMMWQNAYQKFHSYNPEILDRYALFSASVLMPIQSYKIPIITLDKNTPKEAVCQVFENVNTGGVSLTVFELVTAIYAADNYKLREDWEIREAKLDGSIPGKNDVLTTVTATDFLTSMTLLFTYKRWKNGGSAVSCKKKDVLILPLAEYKSSASRLTEAFIEAGKFLVEQRIFSERDLPYSTQLIPLAAVIALLGSRYYDSNIKGKLARWYWCGVMGELYGGANETRYAMDVTGLMAWLTENGPEPDTVTRSYFNPTRLLSLQTRLSAAYKGIMALILKADSKDFISGTKMDFTSFVTDSIDIHHVFPAAYSVKKYNREKWNSIVNKTPLSSRTNVILGGTAPSAYIDRIERRDKVSSQDLDTYIASHCIDPDTLRADDFDGFFIDRSKKLLDLISTATGKAINRDSDEIKNAFGGSLQ